MTQYSYTSLNFVKDLWKKTYVMPFYKMCLDSKHPDYYRTSEWESSENEV